MEKSKLNILIDAFMFLCMMAIAGLGFLMKFVLIPGKERWAKYGRNVELLLLDMDRHQWGTIHLSIAFILLGALTLHIYLHWSMILGIYQKLITDQKRRKTVAIVFTVTCGTLLILPLLLRPEVQELGSGQGRGEHSTFSQKEMPNRSFANESEDTVDSGTHHHASRLAGSIEVRGQMTLGEAAQKYDVPTEYLKSRLNIPESISDEEKLGFLRRECGFTMSDVEKIIEEYGKAE